MSKRITYRSEASTRKEAEAEAIRLLEQVVETDKGFQTVTKDADNEADSADTTVVLLPSGMDAPAEDTPIVYIHRQRKETPEESGIYWLYLLFDRKRLPFIFRSISDLGFILAILRPTIRPENPLPVESILTKEGADELDAALEYVKGYGLYSESTDAVLQDAKDAPQELRLYAFFDRLDRSLQQVKSELEKGVFAEGTADGEIVLNTLTGKTYKTEKAYIKALGDFAGAVEVEKYKEQLLESYGWYKAYRFVRFLLYELLRTEDYDAVESHYKEYATTIGFKEEYMKYITKEGEKYGSAMEYALALYMDYFLRMPFIFGGLNEMRMAEYLKIPNATLQKIYTETRRRSLL